jgi:hypothetical protein
LVKCWICSELLVHFIHVANVGLLFEVCLRLRPMHPDRTDHIIDSIVVEKIIRHSWNIYGSICGLLKVGLWQMTMFPPCFYSALAFKFLLWSIQVFLTTTTLIFFLMGFGCLVEIVARLICFGDITWHFWRVSKNCMLVLCIKFPIVISNLLVLLILQLKNNECMFVTSKNEVC